MKINWKLRLQNKTTLAALLTCLVGVIYQMMGILGITAPVTENEAGQVLNLLLNLLVTMGVLIDPTTKGVSDSRKAMTYGKPN